MKEKIGLIGLGFVGGALHNSFSKHFDIKIFDKDISKANTSSLEDLSKQVKVIFLALPTPINEDETAYLEHIYDLYDKLNTYNNKNIVVIKSSVQPGTTAFLNKTYQNVTTIFNPEFLREKTHIKDFEEQEFIILGGSDDSVKKVSSLYSVVFPNVPIYTADSTIAEMVKFFINTYLATKVSFCNEIYSICQSLDINYDNVRDLALLDKRIGESHTKVPGEPTEKAMHGKGFGLTCLPLNLCILIDLANKLNVEAKILKAVKERNEFLDRPEKDWLIENKTIVKLKSNSQ